MISQGVQSAQAPPPPSPPPSAAAASLRRFLVSAALILLSLRADEAWNEGGAAKYVGHWADVEAGQAWVAGRIIEHGYTSLLHDTVWGQLNGLTCAEVHQRHLLVRVTEPF